MHNVKGYSAHAINQQLGRKGPVWQRGFYDRIIRSETDLEEKVRYLWENPLRAGLTEDPAQYEYSYNKWYNARRAGR